MDDVVTVLMIVAYLGYSFYRASQKRKAAREKAAAKEESRQQPAMEQPVRPVKPVGKTIEQMLEELVMEKAPKEVVLEEDPWEAQSAETIPEVPLRPIEQDFSLEREPIRYKPIEVIESLENNPDNIRMTFDSNPIGVTTHHMDMVPDLAWLYGPDGRIDLRKAVIYSEILNRPYA